MDEQKEDMTCGCTCENCTKGDHEHCTTGTCTWKGKVTNSDMGGDESAE